MTGTGRLKLGAFIGLLAAIVFCGGCNRGPKCYPVRGKVTWQGEPVPLGRVTFYPAAGGRPAAGDIQSDGTYELSSFNPGDGAQAGDYKVAIECVKTAKSTTPLPKSLAEEANMPLPTKVAPPRWLIPEIFASPESSRLKASVDAKTESINFELPQQQ